MLIPLRDGTQTTSPKLDRLIQFDERSRGFSIRPQVALKTPRSYTWRCTPNFDQGREGACVAFALGHELAARPSEVKGITRSNLISKVYWEAQRNDPWAGGSYPGAVPFYEGTSVLAGVKALHHLGAFEEYRWAFGLNDLVLGVGYNGPAVIGVNWYQGMHNTDPSTGYIRALGEVAGGHAVLVRGVNIKESRFTIRNSWGEDWGTGGDAYISFSDMEKLLYEYGEAVFVKKRKTTFTWDS